MRLSGREKGPGEGPETAQMDDDNGDLMTERLPYDTEPIPEEGIDLVAIFAAMAGEWRLALITFLVFAAVALAYVFSLKPQYVATATFLPSQGRTEAESLSSIFSPRGPGNLYIGLLSSRSVQDDIIDRAHLFQLFGTHSYETARAILAGRSSFGEGGDSIIVVAVRDTNSQNAAMIANAYLQGLQDLSDKMAQAQAAQTRKFYDRQLEIQSAELNQAEDAYAKLQERTGEVAPGTQASIGISNIAGLRQQVTSLQVQLAVLRQSETEQNPEVQRVRSQIAQLEAEERVQEAGSGRTPVGAATTAAKIPSVTLELNRAERDVASHTALVNSLSTQFQNARLDEDFSHPAFQVIDRAFAPEARAWPPRPSYIGVSLAFAFLAGLFAIVVKLVIRRISSNPTHRAKLHRLRRAF